MLRTNSKKAKENIFNYVINTYNKEWVSGLCGFFGSVYYYNVSAVDILGNILEETEEERKKYSETQAEEMLTRLIFREMTARLK